MSKAKFTPGPWEICDRHPLGQYAVGISAPEASHYTLAGVWVRMEEDTRDDSRMYANAELIAAAPELYEAGEALHAAAWGLVKNIFGDHPLSIPDGDTSDWANCARAFADASCAWNRSADKARGEQP